MKELTQNEQKKLAAREAVAELLASGMLQSGMKIGLGTGSTAMPAVEEIASLINSGKLKNIKAVCTSLQTELACERLDIPFFSMNSHEIGAHLELTIDGADEVDEESRLIKGGGGALLMEKIVAYNSDTFVIVADESKMVSSLGSRFPLPVEIVRHAYESVKAKLEKTGAEVTLREGIKKCGPVITDNGNWIIDCLWQSGQDASRMEDEIKLIAGVVEVGFFTKNKPVVFTAYADGKVCKREKD